LLRAVEEGEGKRAQRGGCRGEGGNKMAHEKGGNQKVKRGIVRREARTIHSRRGEEGKGWGRRGEEGAGACGRKI
jgi:hypothetical protein